MNSLYLSEMTGPPTGVGYTGIEFGLATFVFSLKLIHVIDQITPVGS